MASLATLLLVVASCSGSGGTSTSVTPGNPLDPQPATAGGTSAILNVVVHDAPTSDVREAWVTFSSAAAHRTTGEWVPLTGTFATPVDLLTLVNGRTLSVATGPVPAGQYDALRLGISSARLVLADGSAANVPLPDGGVVVEHAVDFVCQTDGSVTVTLDFPVATSFRVLAGGVAFSPTLATDTVTFR